MEGPHHEQREKYCSKAFAYALLASDRRRVGREKFAVVLSSFENLEFYESLFPDLSLVEFKLVDYSYLELYAVAEALNEHIPDALARVNSVLGRITISLYIDPDQEEAATSFIRTLDVYDKYKAYYGYMFYIGQKI